ncbi:MAG TPA: methylenetetrahydrofolate reductase [Bacteroidota bacterium]|nr:methylenetetrahydrofolate reductase [Bacteroidota bacterium]
MGLQEKIDAREFVVCAELGPPGSCDGDVLREKSRHLKGYVDAVNITDNQTAIVRLSSIASARILLDEGIEPIMQMTCRDRNRLAIQSDLLGAAALGIRNVLCLTGDYQTFGDQPEAKGVFDLDSVQLIATVATMNGGSLLSGAAMKKPTAFFIGAAANPFAEPFEMRLIRLHKKIAAGARFIQTQPVFDMTAFARWMARVVAAGLHEKAAIIAGVMPVRSEKALHWMNERVPGMRIPDDTISRMRGARDPQAEGIGIAVELIDALKNVEGVRGIHIMPSQWESVVPTLLAESGLHVTH